MQFDKKNAHQQVAEIIRKTWIPILIGLLFPAGSVLAQVHTDSIVGIDSIHVAQNLPADSLNDTVAVAKSDSVPPRRNNALDDPVIYESKDSMVWNYGGYAYLYGNGKVKYQDVVLTAGIIKMQMDSSLVYADGVRDSSENGKEPLYSWTEAHLTSQTISVITSRQRRDTSTKSSPSRVKDI